MCTSSLLKFYFGGHQVNSQTADWQHSLLYGSCAENKNIVTHWARNELYSFYISDRQDPNAMSYVGYLNQEWNAGSTGLGGCDWGGAVLDMLVTMLASLLQPIRWLSCDVHVTQDVDSLVLEANHQKRQASCI